MSKSQQMTVKTFFRQLEEASCIQAQVLVEDFSHPGVCWKCNTTGFKLSSRFLKWIDGNVLTWVIGADEGRCSAELHTYKEELIRDAKVRNKEGMRQIARSQPWTSCSGICLEESPGRWPWREEGFRRAGRSSGLPPSCSRTVRAMCRKSSKGGWRPVWMNK